MTTMAAPTLEGYTPRRCAQDLMRILEANGNDLARAEEEAIPYLRELLKRPDLLQLGVTREGKVGRRWSPGLCVRSVAPITSGFSDTVPPQTENLNTSIRRRIVYGLVVQS
jgi:hypothetical protein